MSNNPTNSTDENAEQTPAFSTEWIRSFIDGYFERRHKDPQKIDIVNLKIQKNTIQGILSKAYLIDISYKDSNPPLDEFEEAEIEECEDGVRTKSIFVKVPLKGTTSAESALFTSFNERELTMLTEVLPKLQTFLDERCDGFFKLPMPEVIHASYDKKGYKFTPKVVNADLEDVFVLENLLESGFENYDGKTSLDESHMMAVLECLSQLHGTGMAYKLFSTSEKEPESQSCMNAEEYDKEFEILRQRNVERKRMSKLKEEFPSLEEQIQLGDMLDSSMREHLKKHFRAFLHFLGDIEPKLERHTTYMQNMHKHILSVITMLENSGFEKLVTFCHGDAKPNNFLFRNIEVDIEDLECAGLQAILIDWQGGFLGSVANDLMWALFPFLEANVQDKTMYSTATSYYHEQLTNVLQDFGHTFQDLGLPESLPEFTSLLQKGFVMEFLIVTIIKPILAIKEPGKLLKWHKETVRNRTRRFKKKVEMPDIADVFGDTAGGQRFIGFCHLYFKIATALGGFQELGRMYFDIMRDSMFAEEGRKPLDDYDSDVDEPDPDMLYRIINTPIPDFKSYLRNPFESSLQKRSWWKIGAVSAVVVATAAGVATMSVGTWNTS